MRALTIFLLCPVCGNEEIVDRLDVWDPHPVDGWVQSLEFHTREPRGCLWLWDVEDSEKWRAVEVEFTYSYNNKPEYKGILAASRRRCRNKMYFTLARLQDNIKLPCTHYVLLTIHHWDQASKSPNAKVVDSFEIKAANAWDSGRTMALSNLVRNTCELIVGGNNYDIAAEFAVMFRAYWSVRRAEAYGGDGPLHLTGVMEVD